MGTTPWEVCIWWMCQARSLSGCSSVGATCSTISHPASGSPRKGLLPVFTSSSFRLCMRAKLTYAWTPSWSTGRTIAFSHCNMKYNPPSRPTSYCPQHPMAHTSPLEAQLSSPLLLWAPGSPCLLSGVRYLNSESPPFDVSCCPLGCLFFSL